MTIHLPDIHSYLLMNGARNMGQSLQGAVISVYLCDGRSDDCTDNVMMSQLCADKRKLWSRDKG